MTLLGCVFAGVSVGASVFTITAMSIDRYLAIRHSMAFRKVFNRKSTIYVRVYDFTFLTDVLLEPNPKKVYYILKLCLRRH